MKRNTFISLLFLIFSLINTKADEPIKVTNFTLKDYNGKEHSLTDYKNSKAIVIIFIATQCPVSNAYNERMEKLYQDYKDKNVAFIGINSNKQESIEEIAEHAKKHNLNFTILKDTGNKIADMFNASVTPEVFVLNKDFNIMYHGRIDDSRRGDNIQHQDLRKALDEILSNKNVSVKETKAFGCTIKRVEQ
ncbi:thioredoxin family protein [Melioribacteraceae bacterium 4301-Me]|uniref:thioredoxin family protein n=1 Tax=Pyranulibacter aquaticus TaxID=3163344 RepID=UPI0035969E85